MIFPSQRHSSLLVSTHFPPIFLLFIPHQKRLKNLNGIRTCTGYLEGVFYESTGCNLVPRLNLSLGWNRARTKIPPLSRGCLFQRFACTYPRQICTRFYFTFFHTVSFISFPPGLFIYSPFASNEGGLSFHLGFIVAFFFEVVKKAFNKSSNYL